MHTINLLTGLPKETRKDIREAAAQIAADGNLLTRAADIPTETASDAGWLVRLLAE